MLDNIIRKRIARNFFITNPKLILYHKFGSEFSSFRFHNFHSSAGNLARTVVVQTKRKYRLRKHEVLTPKQKYMKQYIFPQMAKTAQQKLQKQQEKISEESSSSAGVEVQQQQHVQHVDNFKIETQAGDFVVGELATEPVKIHRQVKEQLKEERKKVLARSQSSGQSVEKSKQPLKKDQTIKNMQKSRTQVVCSEKHRRMVGTIIKGCKGVLELEIVLKANVAFQSQVHYSCALNKLAKMPSGEDRTNVVEYILEQSLPFVQFYRDSALAQMVWALGKMKHHPSQLYTNKLNAALIKRSKDFLPRGYSTVFHGLANLGIMNVKVLDSLSRDMMRSLHYFSAQNLANTAWACATLRYQNNELFQKLVGAVAQLGERLPCTQEVRSQTKIKKNQGNKGRKRRVDSNQKKIYHKNK
eukprot:TRINITY_DN37597_c0_g1_i2.p1 TRINITY_DN37597_c0_g1~~TRINITY_DN37597_c0_g1_i2.p1  ORF type:complete len:413 (-),score=47.53 TRINITY_DN37597_c0_g1_i2:8-1246(-)